MLSPSRPLRPPPGRVGPEGPSAGIRAVPDGAPLLVGDPVGRRTSPAFGLAGSEEPSPPWRSTPCLPGPPSRVVPPCRRHRHRLRGTDASGFGRATLPAAPWSKSVATSQENRLRGLEPGPDHRPPTRRPTDRDLATHSGSKTSLRHGPEPRAEAQSRFRGTRSRRSKTPRTGPDRLATRVASPSDPPARLRSEPAFPCRPTSEEGARRRSAGPTWAKPWPPSAPSRLRGSASDPRSAVPPEENAPSRIGSRKALRRSRFQPEQSAAVECRTAPEEASRHPSPSTLRR